MKLLIIDRSGFQLQTRKMLLEEQLKCDIATASSLGDAYIAFQKHTFDIVLIDNTIENAQQYVDHILQIDPMQPMLVISDAIHCVIRRCGDCVKKHQIRRLNNPTPIKNIVRMVEGFKRYECDHYDEETNSLHN
ncbi:MAG: hypothetical protein PHX59_00230 [Sulfuricurvum sp.]|nr:hypothetical protein [Sulfuricurvum sp.]